MGNQNILVIVRYGLQKDTARDRGLVDSAPYLEWGEQGLIELIPGKVMEYIQLAEWIKYLLDTYDLRRNCL